MAAPITIRSAWPDVEQAGMSMVHDNAAAAAVVAHAIAGTSASRYRRGLMDAIHREMITAADGKTEGSMMT